MGEKRAQKSWDRGNTSHTGRSDVIMKNVYLDASALYPSIRIGNARELVKMFSGPSHEEPIFSPTTKRLSKSAVR